MICRDCEKEVFQVERFCPHCGEDLISHLPMPDIVENPDCSVLESMAKDYIKSISDGSYLEDNDDSQYIFEEVIKTFYGPTIFDWVNKNTP